MLAGFCLLALARPGFAGEIFKWTDENGKLHIADDIDKVPAKHRGQAEEVESGGMQRYESNPSGNTGGYGNKSGSRGRDYSWYKGAGGYSEAKKKRRRTGRAMAVYFYTDWCGYCKKFEKNILPSSKVRQCLSKVIKVRINPEKGARERKIANAYGVAGYPSFFLIKAGSNARRKLHSLFSPKAFVQACESAV